MVNQWVTSDPRSLLRGEKEPIAYVYTRTVAYDDKCTYSTVDGGAVEMCTFGNYSKFLEIVHSIPPHLKHAIKIS